MKTISDYQAPVRIAGNGAAESNEYAASMLVALTDHCALLIRALNELQAHTSILTEMALCLSHTLQRGQKVLVAGNGGSAAQAQHFAAELVGRFKRERVPYPVMALTTDTAILTAVANDYGYADAFARQVRAFGRPDDLLIVFSTSGESENLVRAIEAGRELGLSTAAIISQRRCRLEDLVDLALRVPSEDTATIQELHMVAIHLLCEIVESHLYEAERQRCL